MDMTHSPQLFDALTQAGMQPHAARRVECELQTTIDQRLVAAGQVAGAQMLAKADGVLIDKRIQSVEAQMLTKADGVLIDKRIQNIEAQMLTKADGVLIDKRIQNIEAQMLTKVDGALIDKRIQNIEAQMLTKADGALIEERFQKFQNQLDDFKACLGQMEVRLLRLIHDQGWRLMGFQVALSAMLFAGLRYIR
jgi:translation initiation factor 6 (eIF-6)